MKYFHKSASENTKIGAKKKSINATKCYTFFIILFILWHLRWLDILSQYVLNWRNLVCRFFSAWILQQVSEIMGLRFLIQILQIPLKNDHGISAIPIQLIPIAKSSVESSFEEKDSFWFHVPSISLMSYLLLFKPMSGKKTIVFKYNTRIILMTHVCFFTDCPTALCSSQ